MTGFGSKVACLQEAYVAIQGCAHIMNRDSVYAIL
jgi:hypothetical protein